MERVLNRTVALFYDPTGPVGANYHYYQLNRSSHHFREDLAYAQTKLEELSGKTLEFGSSDSDSTTDYFYFREVT